MGHYAAEMGYQTPAERAQEEKKYLIAAQKQFKENPIPDLKVGDEVTIAVKEYYLLYNSIHRIFLEHCYNLITWAKSMKGIKVLNIKKDEGRTYVYLGRMCYTELWYDAQLFTKVTT
jgi:hypothetical protein